MQVKHPIFWALLLPFILIIWLLLRGIRALLPKRDPVAEQEGASSAEYHRRRQMGYSGDEVESAWSRRVSEPTPPPPATPAPIPFSHPDRTAIADELLKLAKLKEQLQARLSTGAAIVPLEVPVEDNPWLQMAGIYDPSDPDVQEWKEEMRRHREEIERDPNYP